MKTFIQAGNRMLVTAAAAIASDDTVVVGDTIGVAEHSAAIGEQAIVVLCGVFQRPKASSGAIAQGVKVYWDATNSVVTATSSGNKLMGRAFEAAADGATTINVLLTRA